MRNRISQIIGLGSSASCKETDCNQWCEFLTLPLSDRKGILSIPGAQWLHPAQQLAHQLAQQVWSQVLLQIW